jgi:hypothetical protein
LEICSIRNFVSYAFTTSTDSLSLKQKASRVHDGQGPTSKHGETGNIETQSTSVHSREKILHLWELRKCRRMRLKGWGLAPGARSASCSRTGHSSERTSSPPAPRQSHEKPEHGKHRQPAVLDLLSNRTNWLGSLATGRGGRRRRLSNPWRRNNRG